MAENKKYEIPEILYESPSYPGEETSSIPYIDVAVNETMPPVLFLFEYKETGEFERNERGKPIKIIDQIPHKYVDMELLKSVLPADVNDQVRVALGMKPLLTAQREGAGIIDKVMAKTAQLTKEAQSSQEGRIEKHKEELAKAAKQQSDQQKNKDN